MKKICGLVLGLIMGMLVFATVSEDVYAKDEDGDIVIVVDAGHGSVDGGAYQNGISEQNINWSIATALKAELEGYWGVKVYLTRGSSEYNSNTGRGRFGLAVNADLVVSVHNNSGDASVKGVEVYGTINPSLSKITTDIGSSICRHLSALGLVNRGYRTRPSSNGKNDFYTLIDEAVKSGIPAMIIEHCYLSNAGDAAFISNPVNQKKAGTADATAIAEYFGLVKRGVSDGSSLTLIRTYSAVFVTSNGGTFASSDTNVASVDSNGIITAVGEGSADITCTATDGTVETVHITVLPVRMIGITAGINPTFYNSNDTIDNANIILKAIYSDGSVKQITSGFTVSEVPASANGIYDIPISYNGFECKLRVYKTGTQGSYPPGASYKPGNNKDILVLPELFQSVNTGINISLSPVSSEYTGVTVIPDKPEPVTDPPKQPEQTTEAQTTEVQTTEAQTTEAVTEPESDETESYSEEITTVETETVSGENGGKSQSPWQIWLIVILGFCCACAGIATIIIFMQLRKRK